MHIQHTHIHVYSCIHMHAYLQEDKEILQEVSTALGPTYERLVFEARQRKEAEDALVKKTAEEDGVLAEEHAVGAADE